jgi:hypothetical protein
MHRFFYISREDVNAILRVLSCGVLIVFLAALLTVFALAHFAPHYEPSLLLRTSELLIG